MHASVQNFVHLKNENTISKAKYNSIFAYEKGDVKCNRKGSQSIGNSKKYSAQ